ncbi:hypothetical protein QOZ80_9AG0679410 [Eleusine coracana subsp. coracana]|nr:hypothetical protein QOZ80_9AG0679410 [Eleusine coracana subsp. coracana]
MEGFVGRPSSLGAVAWSCAIIATLLALVPTSITAAASPQSDVNVTALCQATPYPSACETALGSRHHLGGTARNADPVATSVRFAMGRVRSARAMARNFSLAASPSGMDDCAELLDVSHDHLGRVLASRDDDEVTTWLSAAMTHQATCGESLATVAYADAASHEAVRARVSALAQFVGAALALHANKVKAGGAASTSSSSSSEEEFPSWLSEQDKKLLLAASPAASGVAMDAVVALDGSGTHRSIGEAIAHVTASAASGGRKVIYVKAGRYEENLNIGSNQGNVMLMGDGMGSTVIVAGKSVGGGSTTYASATVAAMGSGFIAKGLTIQNSAGPGKGQAVALRVGGDLSVIYQCAVQGYQDTLYALSNRQFYAYSNIAGTVDFIFGNAAAVFQNCNIQALRPNSGQEDTVTAQGRSDPNQNTGFSIHRCRITAASNLGGTPVYLGRPWKMYSRTVVLMTYLDGAIAAAGWLEWDGNFALSTLYYGEYGNTGPGAGTSRRVTWNGVHSSMSASDAMRFTVDDFIMGDSWLGGTGVSYVSGL